MKKLSVVLATRNEENNIAECIGSVSKIADEVIVVDESSRDKTREIATKLGAKVFKVDHSDNFHKTKQFALDKAKNDWILQLDADERVTVELSKEIVSILKDEHDEYLSTISKLVEDKSKLFNRHEEMLIRKGILKKQDENISAYFLPRLNIFLGKPIRHAGVYPDPAIRLVRKGKAHFPVKSVHEVMQVDGKVAWLYNDSEHHDSPTLERYLERLNRYTDLQSEDFESEKLPLNYLHLFYYSTLKPLVNFLRLYLRHRGYKDGMRGFVWCVFSSLHFPIAYFKYWAKHKK